MLNINCTTIINEGMSSGFSSENGEIIPLSYGNYGVAIKYRINTN